MRMLSRRLLIAASAFFLLAGIGACATTTDGMGQLVVRDNDQILRFNLQELRDLPQLEIATPQSSGAQIQRGPTVRSILNAAGVMNVQRVRVEGRDPAQTLAGTEVNDEVILNVTKRNTLKLTGTRLPRDRWVRDVTSLIVNP